MSILHSIERALAGQPTDRQAAREKMVQAALARNALLSEQHVAKNALKAAQEARANHPNKATEAALVAAESELEKINAKVARSVEAYDKAEDAYNPIVYPPAPPVTKATTPAPKPFDNVRRQLGRHQQEGSLGWTTPQTRYGVTDQITALIRQKVAATVEDYPTIENKIRELHGQATAMYDAMVQMYRKSVSSYHQDHISELSVQIKSGKDISSADGYSREEIGTDIQAKGDAYKQSLWEFSIQIFNLAQPLLVAGVAAAGELLDQELQHEGERAERFGIPYTEPSEILLSLRAARNLIELRRHDRPVGYTSHKVLVANLVEL